MKYNFLFVIIFAAALFYAGCKDIVSPPPVDDVIIPARNVSYNQHIQPVLEVKCNARGCHEDATRAGGLSFTSYQNTTSDPTVIVPFFPENSRLIWAIKPGASNQMPPLNYPPLTKNQVDGITTWIKEGAKPN